MSQPSPFWSRSYTVIRQRVRLNLYFGETKVSEFNQLLDEATAELGKLGLKPSPEMMFLASICGRGVRGGEGGNAGADCNGQAGGAAGTDAEGLGEALGQRVGAVGLLGSHQT